MENDNPNRAEIETILDKSMEAAFHEFEAQTNLKELYLDSFIKEIFFRHIKAGWREWSAPRRCYFPSCSSKTSISSHAIQRAGSLHFISENGHVSAPKMNMPKARMEMESLGIGEASTFVGFCEKHENIFDYEKNGVIEEDRHIELQIFRTVCHELRQLEHELIFLRESIRLYKLRSQTELILRVIDKLGKKFFAKYKISKISFQTNVENGITELFRTTIADLERNHAKALAFYKDFQETPKSGLTAQGLSTFLMTLPFELPVALSGRTGFSCLEEGVQMDVDLILNVLSFPAKTLFFVTTTEKRATLLERFLSMYPSDLQKLSLIESIMVYGTDHWFLKPSIWEKMPQNKRDKLLDLVLQSEDHIATKCPISIFDVPRANLIADLKEILENTPNKAEVQALIDSESGKLC